MDFINDYLTAALFTETDENDSPLDSSYSIDAFATSAKDSAVSDLDSFCLKAFEALGERFFTLDGCKVAHDFWLTRNGHGAGFWDGDYEQDVGEILTTLSEQFGSTSAYVGDDGKIYFS